MRPGPKPGSKRKKKTKANVKPSQISAASKKRAPASKSSEKQSSKKRKVGRALKNPFTKPLKGGTSVQFQQVSSAPVQSLPQSLSSSAPYFWSEFVDPIVMGWFVSENPHHWGLRCTMYVLMSKAVHTMNIALLHKFSSIASSIGITSMLDIAPPGRHPMAGMLTATLNIMSNFNTFDPCVCMAHDAARQITSPETNGMQNPFCLANRFIYGAKQMMTTHSSHVFTQAFKMEFMQGSEVPLTLSNYSWSLDWFLLLSQSILSADSFRRVVLGIIYIIQQYKTKTSGPLSVSVSGLDVNLASCKTPQKMTIFVTLHITEIGHGQVIYELVHEREVTSSNSHNRAGLQPDARFSSFANLQNLRPPTHNASYIPPPTPSPPGESQILAEHIAAAQAIARLGTDDQRG